MIALPFDTVDRPEIPAAFVQRLVAKQFPQWASLPLVALEPGGWDNRTFRLGDQMVVRLPSAERYAAQIVKEVEWLPRLRKHLPIEISQPLALGQADTDFPFPWAVFQWIPGMTAAQLKGEPSASLAVSLGQFLKALHLIDSRGAPSAGPPFYRGASLDVYNSETTSALAALAGVVDVLRAREVWERALSSRWMGAPVWFHGDFSPQNMLLRDGTLAAIIDFGLCGVGDPACDLVIAWTLLEGESRQVFRETVSLDEDTWGRAQGWALWKALTSLAVRGDRQNAEAQRHRRIINDVISW